MSVFGKIFGGKKQPAALVPQVLKKKVEQEIATARKHGTKNRRPGPGHGLRRKKQYETQLNRIDGSLCTSEFQRKALENASTNSEGPLSVMGSKARKAAHNHMDVDQVHDLMDDIAEQQEAANEIAEVIGNPVGVGQIVDENDLFAGLERLEQQKLDVLLLDVGPTPAAASNLLDAPATTSLPAKAKSKKQEDDDLTELDASPPYVFPSGLLHYDVTATNSSYYDQQPPQFLWPLTASPLIGSDYGLVNDAQWASALDSPPSFRHHNNADDGSGGAGTAAALMDKEETALMELLRMPPPSMPVNYFSSDYYEPQCIGSTATPTTTTGYFEEEVDVERLPIAADSGDQGVHCSPTSAAAASSPDHLLATSSLAIAGVDQLQCPLCHKHFPTTSNRNSHVNKVHKKIRPHQCPSCDKAFATRDHLRRHLTVHTGERFGCDACGTTFGSKQRIAHHLKTNEKCWPRKGKKLPQVHKGH